MASQKTCVFLPAARDEDGLARFLDQLDPWNPLLNQTRKNSPYQKASAHLSF
jgi:hypothetical protein